MQKSLIIFGQDAGEEVLNTALISHHGFFNSIDLIPFTESTLNDRVFEKQKPEQGSLYYHIAIADQSVKKAVEAFAESQSMIAFSVVHPSAVVDPSASIAAGVYIGPLAVVSSLSSIGKHSIVHIHSSIGHHATIGDYCAILPGARVSGRCKLEDGVLVGSNAFIFQGVCLGECVKVDALTYVKNDQPPRRVISCRTPRTPS